MVLPGTGTIGGEVLLRRLWLFTAVSLPLSIRLYAPGLGIETVFPAEPLLALLAVIQVSMLLGTRTLRASLLRAWRSVPGKLTCAWIGVHMLTSITSVDPLASWKQMFVQVVFITAFMLSPWAHGPRVKLDGHRPRDVHDAAFLVVVLFALVAGALSGLDRMAMNHAAFPFFKDHTLYAAVLVFVLLRALGRLDESLASPGHRHRTGFLLVLVAGLGTALVLSFGRGAWVGIALALGVLLFRRVRWARWVFGGAATLVVVGIAFLGPRLYDIRLPENPSQVHGTNVKGTLLSMVNTTTDASNRDRIVRWKAALRMFLAKPVTGHGPGTYQKSYEGMLTPAERMARRQPAVVDDDRTIPAFSFGSALHVRDHAGRSPSSGGTAHSEYLLALSELGIAGGLWWLMVVAYVFWRAFLHPGTDRCKPLGTRWLAADLALIAYLGHAVFNNFLDDPKAAYLFWSSLILLAGPNGGEEAS